MADLIELDIVVRDKTLKQSVSTVDRLERQISKANKAINEGTMSQTKYNKILLAAKREYQALGMSSQKATGQVRAFAAANQKALANTQANTAAVHNNTAALNANASALGNTKNKMNGGNMAIQQLGYQFGDFAVQVQGGTSAFTAFSQQGSQLAGILPMIAGPLGLSMGAAVGLSAALGILIPIGSAIGRMFMEMSGSAEATSKNIDALKESLEELEAATSDVSDAMKFSLEGTFDGAREELNNLLKTYKDLRSEVAKEGLANASRPLVENIADMMDQLSDKKSSRQSILDVDKGRNLLGDDEKTKIVAEMKAIADMQVEAGGFLTAIQSALQGPSENFADNMLKVSKAITNSSSATQEMKDQLLTLLTKSGMLAQIQSDMAEQDKQAVKDKQAGLAMIAKANALEMKLLIADRKEAEKIAEEDRVNNIKTLAAMEIDLYKENAAYIKGEKELDAAGDLAILNNQASREKELKAQNSSYEREQATLRAKEVEEMLKKTSEFAQRLSVPFAMALGLIRQAKQEATVGIDAFGGGGSFKYGGSSKFNGLAIYEANARKATKASQDLKKATDEAEKAAEKLSKALNKPMVDAIGSVSNAFGDFIARGLSDFKSFAGSIVDSFKSMLSQMIATAAKNKIMISMGLGGAGFASGAGAVGTSSPFGGPMGSMLGNFGGAGAAGTGLMGGFGAAGSAAMSGFSSGGLSGGLGGLFNVGGNAAAAGGGAMASIGAVAAPLMAVGLAVSFFSKKVKELDTGLEGTITNMDATINSFRKIQTKRFFGLSKSVSTSGAQLSDEDAAPMIKAVQEIQTSVMNAAAEFGIAGDVFDNFSHDFKLSLKGLSEEAKAAAIQEEFTKMGDAFAELTGHFQTMAEALEAANQRMELRNRLDQLLGNNAAILARNRETELAGMHDLNKNLAQMVYNLEDASAAFSQADAAVGQAFQALRASIDAEKTGITNSFTSLLDGLKVRLDAANESMRRSQGIVDMLQGALSGRSVTQGISSAFSRRAGASNFVSAGDFSDENKLKDALNVLGEPTEGLFGSFVEYARDFGQTSRTLDEAKKVAEVQLNADEAAVVLLEQQIEQANANQDAQLAALEAQYTQQEAAYAALLGIDTSIMSVEGAISALAGAMQAAAAAQAAQAAAAQAATEAASARALTEARAIATATESSITSNAAAAVVDKKRGDDSHSNRIMAETVARAQSNRDNSGGSTSSLSQSISSGWDKVKSWAGFATGGSFGGGMRMVGERGPELEATGPSRIFSHKQTSSMFKDPELKEEIRSLKQEVTGLREDNRQILASNAKFVKRNYDINRKWDTEGLPATRV